MPDPLSISASIVGVTVPALHVARLLLDDLRNIKDAPKAMKRLEGDVQSVEQALSTLQTVEEREWILLGTNVMEQSKSAIDSCKEACGLFRDQLQRWTKRSDGKLAWQDRANIGFFKQAQLKAMSEQLQNCKLSITSTVSIATLYSSVRHSRMTEEIQKTIATRQTDVTRAIDTADRQLIVLEDRIEELDVSESGHEEDAGEADKAEALAQLQQARSALETSRKLLEELLSKSQEEAVAKAAEGTATHSTNMTFGNGNSGFQAGAINGAVSGISFGAK